MMSCVTFRHSNAPAFPATASLSRTLRDTPLLSAEQESKLAFGVAQGHADARDQLVCSNLRLVVTIAADYLGHGLEMDDLAAEGNLGLIRAAQDFKPEFGTRFSTYASYWIKQAIRDALTNRTAMIRLPSHMVILLGKWRRTERALTRELGEAPAFDRVAVALELTDPQRKLVGHARRARRLQSGGEEARLDGAGNDSPRLGEALERSEVAEGLRDRMARRLDAREREIITLRFGLNDVETQTLKEVGRRLGVTHEWARKIEIRAIAKLRAPVVEGSPVVKHVGVKARGYAGTDV
jgi:RNA polymerase primary sigma factor